MDLKEAPLVGGSQDGHWYYASKSRALLAALDGRPVRRVCDVGAGTGYFAKMLLRETAAREATCIDTGYQSDWSEVHAGKPLVFRREGPLPGADLFLLMDVIEHVDDDVALLREVANAAPSGATVVVSVPAFSWLWSAHDVFLEHRRRYTLRALEQVVRAARLTPARGFYFFAAIFPAAAAQRLWRRVRPPRAPSSDLRAYGAASNCLLTWIGTAEAAVARRNRAFGLTAFAVAEKR